MPLIWKFTAVFAIAGGNERVGAQAAAGGGKAARGVGHHASGREHREVEEVPAVQRQFLHRGVVDDLADGNRLGFDLLPRCLLTCTVSPAVETASCMFCRHRRSTSSVIFGTL